MHSKEELIKLRDETVEALSLTQSYLSEVELQCWARKRRAQRRAAGMPEQSRRRLKRVPAVRKRRQLRMRRFGKMVKLSPRQALALPVLSLARLAETLRAKVERQPVLELPEPTKAQVDALAEVLADIVLRQVLREMEEGE